MTHFLITGTGRCGTGYVAKGLSAYGIPTSHEAVFTPSGFKGWGAYAGGCSWLAAPLLSAHEGPVYQLVREPTATLSSLVASGVLDGDGPFTDWIRRYAPEVFYHAEVKDRAQCFWLTWNQMIAPHVQRVLRIEDLNLESLARDLGYEPHLVGQLPPSDYNTTSRPHPDFAYAELWDEVRELAKVYGYGEPDA